MIEQANDSVNVWVPKVTHPFDFGTISWMVDSLLGYPCSPIVAWVCPISYAIIIGTASDVQVIASARLRVVHRSDLGVWTFSSKYQRQ